MTAAPTKPDLATRPLAAPVTVEGTEDGTELVTPTTTVVPAGASEEAATRVVGTTTVLWVMGAVGPWVVVLPAG